MAHEKDPGTVKPQMTILSDRPTSFTERDARFLPDHDLLNLECNLSVVLDILRHRLTKCPITVAIYGDWGTGKTSALHWLEYQLKLWNKLSEKDRTFEYQLNGKTQKSTHPRVYPIWFDPWKYHDREDVWRGIISEVILSTFDATHLTRQDFVSRMKLAARSFGAFLGKGFLHALANTELSVKGAAKAAGNGGEAELKLSGEMFREIYEEFEKANHPEKAFLNQFEHTLQTWVKHMVGDDARIALFIDDLDRCLPEVTLEVLEAIKLYLNIPEIIFLVGLDRDVVDSVVTKHYQEHGLGEKKAKEYLNKLFQVEIQIPPSQQQMEKFLAGQLGQLDSVTRNYWEQQCGNCQTILEDGIRRLSRNNPREVKRLFNSALMRGRAAMDNGPLKDKHPSAPLFAQGVQFFLIQRVVRNCWLDGVSRLLEPSMLEWLDQWSKLVQQAPAYRPDMGKSGPSEELHDAAKPKVGGIAPGASVKKTMLDVARRTAQHSEKGIRHEDQVRLDKEFEAIRNSPLLEDTGRQLLLGEDLLWEILQIPFNIEVAQSAPSTPVPKAPTPTSAPTPEAAPAEDKRPPMSDLLRGKIAQALDKAVDEIQETDLAKVRELNFSNSKITDADLQHLEKLTALQTLILNDTPIADAELKGLEKLTALQMLALNGTPITDAGLKCLEKLTALHVLDLSDTQITNAGLKGLEKLTALQWLGLSNTPISDAGLKGLEKLTALQVLILSGTHITDAGLKGLEKLTALKWLVLKNTKVTQSRVEQLRKALPKTTIEA